MNPKATCQWFFFFHIELINTFDSSETPNVFSMVLIPLQLKSQALSIVLIYKDIKISFKTSLPTQHTQRNYLFKSLLPSILSNLGGLSSWLFLIVNSLQNLDRNFYLQQFLSLPRVWHSPCLHQGFVHNTGMTSVEFLKVYVGARKIRISFLIYCHTSSFWWPASL